MHRPCINKTVGLIFAKVIESIRIAAMRICKGHFSHAFDSNLHTRARDNDLLTCSAMCVHAFRHKCSARCKQRSEAKGSSYTCKDKGNTTSASEIDDKEIGENGREGRKGVRQRVRAREGGGGDNIGSFSPKTQRAQEA